MQLANCLGLLMLNAFTSSRSRDQLLREKSSGADMTVWLAAKAMIFDGSVYVHHKDNSKPTSSQFADRQEIPYLVSCSPQHSTSCDKGKVPPFRSAMMASLAGKKGAQVRDFLSPSFTGTRLLLIRLKTATTYSKHCALRRSACSQIQACVHIG